MYSIYVYTVHLQELYKEANETTRFSQFRTEYNTDAFHKKLLKKQKFKLKNTCKEV